MDKRLQLEIDEKVQHKKIEGLNYSTNEFSGLPPCFSCSIIDCDAVSCIKLEIWFNRTRQMY